jgi:PIN domain nuclease of toxin-antitoxin system
MGDSTVTYLLDTHVWIWWNMHPRKLSARVRSLLSAIGCYDELLLSAISLWEFGKLLEKGRLAISCDPEEWMKEALQMPKLRMVPLSPSIALRSTTLPQPFHDDPADEIIVATARDENAAVLTSDHRIRAYPHCRSVW